MKNKIHKIGFGGGCHWCTEAVFQSLKGVEKVEQGFIASNGDHASFSEAVIVYFDPTIISLKELSEIHLYTHKSTSEHSMRSKYRSAIYYFEMDQKEEIAQILSELQSYFDQSIVTKALPFCNFKASETQFQNYYYNNPEKPFCERHIHPKLSLLRTKFKKVADHQKINRKEPIL